MRNPLDARGGLLGAAARAKFAAVRLATSAFSHRRTAAIVWNSARSAAMETIPVAMTKAKYARHGANAEVDGMRRPSALATSSISSVSPSRAAASDHTFAAVGQVGAPFRHQQLKPAIHRLCQFFRHGTAAYV